MMSTHTNKSRSTYAADAEYIFELTGRDCSGLDAYWMDRVGMAAENAALAWERDERYGAESIEEITGSYVGIIFDDNQEEMP